MLYEKHVLDVPYEKCSVSAEGCKAVLTSFVPDKLPNDSRHIKKPALIICPGGGYDYCSVREAEPVALRFVSYGIVSFVLEYSCVQKPFPINLLELAAAVKYVRENAEKFDVDPGRIYVCGFSAGGHLAGSLAVHWNKPFAYEPFGAAPDEIKPDGAVLCYPVITSGEKRHDGSIRNLIGDAPSDEARRLVSLEKQVDGDTVPAFIWCTADDGTVPAANTLMFASALSENGIPFACHIFPEGVHGLAMCDDSTANYDGHINPECAEWARLAVEWIKKGKKNG